MADHESNELKDIVESFDSKFMNSKENPERELSSDSQQKTLSKSEIADEFDIQFAKKSGGNSQHLVPPEESDAICGVGLGSDVNRSDTPGPFDALCGNCRKVIEGGRTTTSPDRADLRRWLSDKIDKVEPPKDEKNPARFDKRELAAIVSHIRSSEEEIN